MLILRCTGRPSLMTMFNMVFCWPPIRSLRVSTEVALYYTAVDYRAVHVARSPFAQPRLHSMTGFESSHSTTTQMLIVSRAGVRPCTVRAARTASWPSLLCRTLSVPFFLVIGRFMKVTTDHDHSGGFLAHAISCSEALTSSKLGRLLSPEFKDLPPPHVFSDSAQLWSSCI